MGESLPGTDGEVKMSKSMGNDIPLLSEPWDMFGKVMSIPDKAMPIYHKLILGWTPAQIQELEDGLDSGTLHPNDAKMRLAREIVTIYHSAEGAEAAQKRWDEVQRNRGLPDDIPVESLTEPERVLDILRRLKMVGSGNEAKRLMEQDGVRLNGELVKDFAATITPDMLPVVLQVGKRKFVRLVAKVAEGQTQ